MVEQFIGVDGFIRPCPLSGMDITEEQTMGSFGRVKAMKKGTQE